MTADDFPEFFSALWGENFLPFPWQIELARRACAGDWPGYIAVPTGSGKTTCLDIAIFALAVQADLPLDKRSAARRIFFIVNRRVIVDEAYNRAREISERLAEAEISKSPVLKEVARRLRLLAGSETPLDCVQLRGAIYRDNQWVRSLTQPTVIASTVDQVGSRLLFRGYGVSERACPIHAALVGNDSLLILDEAHISQPFAETIQAVKRYREHAPSKCLAPFHFVQMTATPPPSTPASDILRITEKDKENVILGKRLRTSKPATLVLGGGVKSSKNSTAKLAAIFHEEAIKILEAHKPGSIAIMVNRVATARAVTALLQESPSLTGADVSMLIGRMRPLDRDRETKAIETDLKTNSPWAKNPQSERKLRVVVATQCLEVGADLDFDALVTECASIDALRQRFGRLNRAGRDIDSRATIVMRDDLLQDSEQKLAELDAKQSYLDPIYGNGLTRTWNWLREVAKDNIVDFGIEAMTLSLKSVDISTFYAPTVNAPILMPSHLDAWVQTNPRPMPDPDPSIFLHGPDASQPDIQVCWRADLSPLTEPTDWIQILSLCPPSTSECVTLPLVIFKEWLFNDNAIDDQSGDVLVIPPGNDGEGGTQTKTSRVAFVWKGPKSDRSRIVKRKGDLRPGDTIVLPVSTGGWATLCHVPGAPPDPDLVTKDARPPVTELRKMDLGNEAYSLKHRRAILRLRPEMFPDTQEKEILKDLLGWAMDPNSDSIKKDILSAIKTANDPINDPKSGLSEVLTQLSSGFVYTRYPDQLQGVVMRSKQMTSGGQQDAEDEVDDRSFSGEAVTLEDHTQHVTNELEKALKILPLHPFADSLVLAAVHHDWGKKDPRFQAMLLRGNRFAALSLTEPLAKSENPPLSWQEFEQIREAAGLPANFRHEMLSVQWLESEVGLKLLPEEDLLRDLVLHVIASHHGFARPFAPVVHDDDPPSIREKLEIQLTTEQRKVNPPHHSGSGIADRFWRLTRHYGWWGLAYLEAVLRIADQVASEKENVHPQKSK